MKRIAIIGGGVSGLSAAFSLEELRQKGAKVEYSLLEATSRLGGVLRTENVDDCLVEAGPDSFLTEKPWASDLCRRVGIGDQLIGSNDAERKTYILLNRRLVPLPDGLMFMVPTNFAAAAASPLFSNRTKLRILRERFLPPQRHESDESVAAFVERHYGSEMVERLADPLLSGIYGGQAKNLSVRAVLPRFAEMEAQYGSLGKGMLATRKKSNQVAANSSAVSIPSIFTSLRDGMQSMSDAIAARLPDESVRTGAPVQGVQREGGGWVVSAGFGSDEFDGIIFAVPAHAAAQLLGTMSDDLAGELRGIPYSSSVTVAMVYSQDVRASLPPGFGFLVPRSEGLRMLAVTFVHNKFPHRAPPDRALLRCFLSGTEEDDLLELSDEHILAIIHAELRQTLDITADPRAVRIFRWKNAMAQYSVGHLERLVRIDRLMKNFPTLALAGNGYRGIGIPDCVRSGQQAVARVSAALGLAPITSE
jgi:oxygen-dependent protoporphyrinogen oxidase